MSKAGDAGVAQQQLLAGTGIDNLMICLTQSRTNNVEWIRPIALRATPNSMFRRTFLGLFADFFLSNRVWAR